MEELRIDEVVEAVREAGELILRYYENQSFSVAIKADDSPVTSADMASHELLLARLKALGGLPVLSEEDPPAFEERRAWERFWLVDPLDGTKDFIERTDDFTVNVALIEKGAPAWGVVGVPAQGVIYCAMKGRGAFRLVGGERTPIYNNRRGGDLICAVSRFHLSRETIEFCRRNGIKETKAFGSAVKLCQVAEGSVDVYPRLSPTSEWDIAAGHCIVNEGGGRVIGVTSGSELRYNKENLVNEGFVAAREGLGNWEL